MTEISTAYNALVTRLTSLLSTHKRLSNPYVLSDNNDRYLEKGWGLAVGPAVNSNREISGRVSVLREFTIPITRKFFAKEHDVSTKATTELAILEDVQIVIDDLEENVTLDSGRYLVKYVGDSGITQVRDDQEGLLAVLVNVTVEYFRSL